MANTPTILAIECATEHCSVALNHEGQVLFESRVARKGHTALILEMVQACLSGASLTLSACDAIAYAAGPGSFTGIRLACAITQGLSMPDSLPVIRLSSLQILAQAANREFKAAKVLVGLDARNQSVYFGCYQQASDESEWMDAVSPDTVCSPSNVLLSDSHSHNAGSWLAIGHAWQTYYREFPDSLLDQVEFIHPDFHADARVMLPLADREFHAGKLVAAEFALPNYLRNDIVQIKQAQAIDSESA